MISGEGSPGAEQSPIERLERLVVREIADLESARDLRGDKRVSGDGAERTAPALARLTRTLQTIRTMRGEPEDSDDRPVDIDERRRRLAARIGEIARSRRAQAAEATGAAAAGTAEPAKAVRSQTTRAAPPP